MDGIRLINNFTQDKNIFKKIKTECKFENFNIKNNILSRKGSFEGKKGNEWLRCPSINKVNLMSSVTKEICNKITKEFKCELNIAKIQSYPNGKTSIVPHVDKIIDLCPKTPIFICRYGAERTCVLINKKTKEKVFVRMKPDSLLIIPYKANLKWKHGIIKDNSDTESISIVFRNTLTRKFDKYVYGVHTPFLTINNLYKYIEKPILGKFYTDEKQDDEMVKCFKLDNSLDESHISIYTEILTKGIYA